MLGLIMNGLSVTDRLSPARRPRPFMSGFLTAGLIRP